MATEQRLIDVQDCPCDGCQAKPCVHPARCMKFAIWLNKTVDAVEVVRCKNCKYYKPVYQSSRAFMCFNSQGGLINAKYDDFCSYGERRTDG